METNQKIEYEEPKLDTTDQKDRFSILRSHPIALSSLAVKDQESCQIMKEAFDMAEEGLKNLYKEPTIVDEFGSRCGKHKVNKSNKVRVALFCNICDGSHSIDRCPHCEEEQNDQEE